MPSGICILALPAKCAQLHPRAEACRAGGRPVYSMDEPVCKIFPPRAAPGRQTAGCSPPHGHAGLPPGLHVLPPRQTQRSEEGGPTAIRVPVLWLVSPPPKQRGGSERRHAPHVIISERAASVSAKCPRCPRRAVVHLRICAPPLLTSGHLHHAGVPLGAARKGRVSGWVRARAQRPWRGPRARPPASRKQVVQRRRRGDAKWRGRSAG